MGNYYSNRLTATFSGSNNAIVFSKAVVRTLGYPAFVSIRVTEDLTSLAVVPSEAKEVLSFRVPEKLFEQKPVFRIYSKPFLDSVMPINHLERMGTYICEGRYNPEQNAVIFPLANMMLKGTECQEAKVDNNHDLLSEA